MGNRNLIALVMLFITSPSFALSVDDLRRNIINIENSQRISYANLTPTEKQVVDYAIKQYLSNIAVCDGVTYARGNQRFSSSSIFELNNNHDHVYIRTIELNSIDRLNGLVWHGEIYVTLSNGSTREILGNQQFARWYASSSNYVQNFGSQGLMRTLTFYKNKLYNYDAGAAGQRIFENTKQLTCAEVKEAFYKTSTSNVDNELQIKQDFQKKIFDAWKIPFGSEGAKATAVVSLDDNGNVVYIFVNSSDPNLKSSIANAIRAAAPYPMPEDPEARKLARRLTLTLTAR